MLNLALAEKKRTRRFKVQLLKYAQYKLCVCIRKTNTPDKTHDYLNMMRKSEHLLYAQAIQHKRKHTKAIILIILFYPLE